MKAFRAGLLFSLSAVLWSGCAQERAAIDRVQPNYIDKSTLAGEWYYGRTVVDVPGADTFTFVGGTDFAGLKRVVFDVQEDYLYARRTTELVKGADGKEVEGQPYVGEVVAAFRIESHFDIQKQYNSTTGEEINVLEENSVDRPWYERRYARVDWSENLVHNYDLDFEAQSVESVPYFVQEIDPATGEPHPDAPHFEDGYFDVTTKLFAKAGTIDFPGYGQIPLCWLSNFGECGASEYTIRHSFLRVGDRQYEKRPYKGRETETFGFFTTDRMVYDPESGVRVQGTERYLNRHNIWKRSFTDRGNPIAVELREPKPIVYHVNQGWPEGDDALNTAARAAADDWNQVFMEVVQAAGATPPARMFILCEHNPVQEGDPAECGAAGDTPRLGDVRYSFLAYVPKFMEYGLLGLGPSNTDPETGEIISGMAYVYHWNNIGAYQTMEMIKLLNGSKDPTSFIDGVDLTEWREQVLNPMARLDNNALDKAIRTGQQIAASPAARYWDSERRAPTAADEAFQREHGVQAWLAPFLNDMHQRGLSRADHADRAKLARLVGSEIEQAMLPDDLFMGMGFDPNVQVSDEMRDQASVLRGGFGKFAADRARALDAWADKRNLYTVEMADNALMGLAREYADSTMSEEEIVQDLRRIIYSAVLTHESGHSLGLMHNFGGSDDAINYFDRYWEIRDDGNVGPRMVDPLSNDEINQKIYDYAYSSIMDYAGRYTIDGGGVGKYDRAAMLFGYANKMEVFRSVHGMQPDLFREWFLTSGDPLFLSNDPIAPHYTQYYNAMGSDLYSADNRELKDVSDFNDSFTSADGKIRVPYVYCSHSRSDLGDNCLTRDYGADSYERMQNIMDELSTWYIQRSFPRGVIGNDQWSYVGRYYGRIYHRIKQWNDIFGLYKDLLPRYYTEAQLSAFYSDPDMGWGAKTLAIHDAFNYLMRTILMPTVGGYTDSQQSDGTQVYTLNPYIGGSNFDLGVEDARYYSTSWWDGSRNCGYTWWECLHHVGFYLDKIMAIEAMSDSDTNFVGRATPEDVRDWRVSYYNTFPERINEISAALTGQNWQEMAPVWCSGQLVFPDYALGELPTCSTRPVDPEATFTIQLYWQVLGKARFVDNFNPTFAEESRVFEMGTGQQPEVDPNDLATFRDPVGLTTYGAIRRGVESAGEKAIGRANTLLARSSYCDSTDATIIPDDDCIVPAAGHTQSSVDVELQNYVELLKSMVRIESLMNWGDPYNP